MRNIHRAVTTFGAAVLLVGFATARELPPSEGIYRLPYADGTQVKVFDDFTTHRPIGRVDLFAVAGQKPYRVVAAAAGKVVAIQDGYSEQQSGRAAADCRNNYVWIAHPNGEWTTYSHLAKGSVTERAKLRVGSQVEAGTYLGDEAAVGCAMLDHLHFEVAVPRSDDPIDAGGFLLDNEAGKRQRNPRFCGVADEIARKGATYRAEPCIAGFVEVPANQVKWQAHPAIAGAEYSVLLGKPLEAGPLIVRVKLPADAQVLPHTHPEARTYTVLAGEWKLGFGTRYDATALKSYSAGSMYRLPAKVAHFQSAGPQGAIVQIESIGPTSTDFIRER